MAFWYKRTDAEWYGLFNDNLGMVSNAGGHAG